MNNEPTNSPANAESTQPPKATTKPAKSANKADPPGVIIKCSPINPAWATEVAKAYGLAGPLADAVAEQLVLTISHAISKVTKPDKLLKLVKEATNECIGTV